VPFTKANRNSDLVSTIARGKEVALKTALIHGVLVAAGPGLRALYPIARNKVKFPEYMISEMMRSTGTQEIERDADTSLQIMVLYSDVRTAGRGFLGPKSGVPARIPRAGTS